MKLNETCYVVHGDGEINQCFVHHVDEDGDLELKHKEKESYYTWNPELKNEGWEKSEWIYVFSTEDDAVKKSNEIRKDFMNSIEESITFDSKGSMIISMIDTLSHKIAPSNQVNAVREYLQDKAMELGLL